MAAISPSRKAAFAILKTIERGHAHSDDLLRGKSVAALSDADRHLTTALVLGTLRWQIEIGHRVRSLLKPPNGKLDVDVLIGLRVGAFQLQHMGRIPARSAIDESVELTKQSGHHFASGMVNAVLRRLSNAPTLRIAGDSAANLALSQAHPAWMVERWAGFYGLEAARAICSHGQSQPSLTARIESRAAEEELVAAGIKLEPGELLTASRAIAWRDVTNTAAFREGRLRLQDEGSQLVAEIAGRGNAVLDCCAAPGGKTLILAERNPRARIVAFESSPQRLAQLSKRLEQLRDRVECRLADVTLLSDEAAY